MSNEKESIFSAKNLKYLTSPFSANNPVIVQILGICSALAVTVQMKPAIVMALSVAAVTGYASTVTSCLRTGVTSRIRINVQLVVAAPASWAFAKLRFAGRRFLLLGYIALMVLPFQVLMVPNYLIATRLGIYDTPLFVILPGVFSAFPVFIMTRSFQDVPNELLGAAKLDGATAWQICWKIGVPLGYAGIFAALVLNFIEGWNAVEQPLLFLKSQSNWPLSMYMNDIVTDNLGIAMAASLLSLIPAMLVFLYGQTYLELGIQAGGIKA
mgnify:CR=1 FL=1